MKKVMITFVAACLMVLASSFSLPAPDAQQLNPFRYYLLEDPVEDVSLNAYDCVTREAVNVVVCPGTGVKCVATVPVGPGEVTVVSQKGVNRQDVERVQY